MEMGDQMKAIDGSDNIMSIYFLGIIALTFQTQHSYIYARMTHKTSYFDGVNIFLDIAFFFL